MVTVAANGADSGDDTAAFQDAIDRANNGAVFVPEGRYIITDVLRIAKSGVVLRGAGRDKTVLYFPKSLGDILGYPYGEVSWSFSGGLITVQGTDTGSKLADVTAAALRGDRQLTLSSTAGIQPGSMIQLVMHESDGSLGRHLHAGQMDAGSCLVDWSEGVLVDWVTKVVAISGTTVTLERPLRLGVRLGWRPEVYAYEPTLQEVGIEDLTIEFPVHSATHNAEPGYNGIQFLGVTNSWIRDLTILNADGGVYLEGARFNTVEGLRLAGQSHHHGVEADAAQDNLITRFRFDTTFMHDLTVQFLANGNVFSDGSGVDINFDHHRAAPYENLFSDIDVGTGSRVFDSAGNDCAGPHSGARETFWNVRTSRGQGVWKTDWPQINIIGGNASQMTATEEWIEGIPLAELVPVDLYQGQLARRLGTPSPACPFANLARCATATASSAWSSGYTAALVNDGNGTTRWNSASGNTAGAWLALDFGAPTTFDTIVLKEAINRITGYTLQYWDGTAWRPLEAGTTIGPAKTHTVTALIASQVRLVITSIISGPAWITPTLYEFEVYRTTVTSPANRPPTADAGLGQTVLAGDTVTLDGRGSSDPDGNPLLYQWDFADGTTGTGAVVTHTYATPGIYPATLTVTDGTLSASDTVLITVNAAACPFANLARCATATASSVWSSSYTAAMANDANGTTRWNSARGEAAGAWLALDFGALITFDTIVLKEAINRITGYTLQYWDGTAWRPLVAGTTIGRTKTHTFAPLIASQVRLVITSVIRGFAWVTPTLYELELYGH